MQSINDDSSASFIVKFLLQRKGKTVFRTLVVFILTGIVSSSVGAETAYYDTVDNSTPQSLRDSLHEIIDDHTRFPYTSGTTDTWDILEIADENQDNANNIITIYRNATYLKVHGGNDFYNREHTWPKSYGFPDNGASLNYPYTDMHHLFLADVDYNFNKKTPLILLRHGITKRWHRSRGIVTRL